MEQEQIIAARVDFLTAVLINEFTTPHMFRAARRLVQNVDIRGDGVRVRVDRESLFDAIGGSKIAGYNAVANLDGVWLDNPADDGDDVVATIRTRNRWSDLPAWPRSGPLSDRSAAPLETSHAQPSSTVAVREPNSRPPQFLSRHAVRRAE